MDRAGCPQAGGTAITAAALCKKCWFPRIFYAEKEGKFIAAISFSQSGEQAIRSKGVWQSMVRRKPTALLPPTAWARVQEN